MRYLPLMLIFLAGFLPSVAEAGAANSLSTVQVPVQDQSRSERERAIDEGMQTVVLRLVGRQEFLDTPEVRSVTSAGSRYLRQYSYETIEPVQLSLPGVDGQSATTTLAFRASFDTDAIAARLKAAGVPLWARERPLTQVWVAYSTGVDRELLRDGSPASGLLANIRRAGVRRGVPLDLPAANTEGPRVAFTDVWGVFEQPLLDAANAAGLDNVLAVRVFQDSGNWVGRFTLLGSAVGRESWELQAASPADVLDAGVDRLAEIYATEFSVVPTLGGGSEARLEIENAGSLAAYGKIINYLSSLSAVESVQVRKVEGSTLEISLQLSGTTRALERAIEIGRVLQPLDSGEVVPLGSIAGIDFSTDRILRYRYRQD